MALPSSERAIHAGGAGVGGVGGWPGGRGGVWGPLAQAVVEAITAARDATLPLASRPLTSKRCVERQRKPATVYDVAEVVPSGCESWPTAKVAIEPSAGEIVHDSETVVWSVAETLSAIAGGGAGAGGWAGPDPGP